MRLTLRREPSANRTTFGVLSIEDQPYCQTLEDPIRQLPMMLGESPNEWVARWKVQNETAIPSGTFQVKMQPSPHYGGRLMPHLIDVPGYQYVMIHPLNTASQTDGCIGVGLQRGELDGQPAILQSVLAFDPLYARIKDCEVRDEMVTIWIVNPPAAG